MAAHAATGRDAALARDLDSGFVQIRKGEPGSSEFPLVTYLSSDHQGLSFSSDGAYVYSFATDPNTGYVQLFRKSL
jgi:hypothetical protein